MAGTGQGWAGDAEPAWTNNPYKETDGRPEIHAVIADSEGNKAKFRDDGAIHVTEPVTSEVLIQVLQELKAINYHLNLITDANLKDSWQV